MNIQELSYQVKQILRFVWDPIGVSSNGFPEAHDEYDSYVDRIAGAAADGATVDKISGILSYIATKQIGLDNNKERDDRTAEAIVAWASRLK